MNQCTFTGYEAEFGKINSESVNREPWIGENLCMVSFVTYIAKLSWHVKISQGSLNAAVIFNEIIHIPHSNFDHLCKIWFTAQLRYVVKMIQAIVIDDNFAIA